MKKSILSVLFALLLAGSVQAQFTAKEKFFADYEEQIEEVRAQNGSVLSPTFFSKAVELYEEALEAYEEKESQKAIREKLDESAQYVRRALDVIKLANITLKEAIQARRDALNSDAPLYAENLWNEAEQQFRDAAENLEDDDVEDAREDGVKATQLYSQAELTAIKNGILGEARDAIAVAREMDAEDYAYHTLTDAQNLLTEAERMLNADRYNREEAIEKAGRAAYQGRHAQYLTETIKQLSKRQENWENLFLKFEEIIATFGSQFNYNPMFDKGFDSSVKTISAYIKVLKDEKKQLIEENNRLSEELQAIKERAENYSAELERKQERERKVDRIKNLFGPNEAKVIYEGDNLIIRLFGLNFPSGQAIIQPEYFSLLTKIQQSLREFPESHYLIEGHTDSQGDANRNKLLSERRAQSVREYLIANMNISEEQISHIGFGEEQPVASNETSEGRAANRRIDVVIHIAD